jgi:predicted enzyme related to lactoylglutathione lyase
MATVYRLEHVGIGTPEPKLEETIQFYQTVLGWERTREQPGILAFVGDGQVMFEIFRSQDPPLQDPHHLAFSVNLDDFDNVAQAIRDNGATAMDEPFINDFGDRIVFFNDPGGNRAQIVARVAPVTKN